VGEVLRPGGGNNNAVIASRVVGGGWVVGGDAGDEWPAGAPRTSHHPSSFSFGNSGALTCGGDGTEDGELCETHGNSACGQRKVENRREILIPRIITKRMVFVARQFNTTVGVGWFGHSVVRCSSQCISKRGKMDRKSFIFRPRGERRRGAGEGRGPWGRARSRPARARVRR